MRRALLLFFVLAVAATAQQRPRIAVAGISHESNSFNPAKTTLADFGSLVQESEAQFIAERANSNSTVAGYIAGAKTHGLELYPTLVGGASPKGPVTGEAFETMMAEMIRRLKAAPKLDGVLMPLHGAMVVETYQSGDAEIVRRVREAMGPKMPIVVTHDFHANVAPDIVRDSSVLITFKENPHIDTKERGEQAADVIARIVRGEVRPTQTLIKPPMVYNIVFQHTKAEPLLLIVEESRRLERENPKILAVSVSGGYQYADAEWMGPTVIVATDNDPDLAEREAQRLSNMMWETRDRIVLREPSPAEAVRMAMEHDGRPVGLIDLGDNIGGGTPGDSTFILEELVRQNAQGWVVVIADPAAYAHAEQAGIGKPFDFEVGGKTDNMHGKPVRIRGRVRSLHEGRYVETEVRHGGGRYWSMGHTAVIHVDGSTMDEQNLLLVTTRRSSPNSAHQIISNGIYPERQKIIVLKGAIAPRAAWEPLASKLIPVDTPGATSVNPAHFEFKNVRPGLWGMGKD